MTKNAKTLLIVLGIFALTLIICIVGLGFLVYYFIDNAGLDKMQAEGREFGKTTDNPGCQTKVISMVKPIGLMDINGSLKAQYFFEECLDASRPSPNFCDNVPGELRDVINDDKWKDAECQKFGFKDVHPPCRAAMKAKMSYCEKKH